MARVIEDIRSQDEYRELYELATVIRNQKLLADAESESLERHKQEVSESAINLLTEAWRSSCWNTIGRQLKCQTLDPTIACKLLKRINETEALPAYRHVGRYFSYLDQLLTVMYNEPSTVAELLHNVDQNDVALNDSVIQTLFHMVYSCGLYPEDELRLAEVVCYLLKLQLLKYGRQMRTMLRKESSMSTRFYKHFVEQMHPTMVYLTRALRRGVLDVIQLGSFWLDIDVKQSTTRFLRDNKQNADRLPEYRALVVSKLVELVDNFLEGILQALPMLPPNLNWIIRDIYCSLYEVVDDVSAIELSHACKDMIISNLICPAIISPQKFGVVDNDVRIGSIVNHNLVQIAMIIQVISLREFETPPDEYKEFLSQCRKTHLISEMMDALLVEKLAPEVEIISLVANGKVQSDVTSKPNFVGSIADVNTLVKLINNSPPTDNQKLAQLVKICSKLPPVLTSTVEKPTEISDSFTNPTSTLRNIHRRVQHSFKRSSDANEVSNSTASLLETEVFKKENFDLFFLEYSLKNYQDLMSQQSSPSQNSPREYFHPSENQDIPPETQTNEEVIESEPPYFLEPPETESELCSSSEATDIKPVSPDIEATQSTDSKLRFSKLKSLSDKMRKGITQSNTFSDIRGHLRRSGSLIQKETGVTASNSDQVLSELAKGPRDDILAKYASITPNKSKKSARENLIDFDSNAHKEDIEPYYSSENPVACRAFQDTIRKMVTVLGNLSYLPKIGYRRNTLESGNKKFLLDQFLDGVLVETEHRREYGQAAQLREVKRCIEIFDQDCIDCLLEHLKLKGHQEEKVIAEMREERAGLMRKTNDISSLEQRVLLNRRLTEEIIVDFLTRTFLETGFDSKNTVGKTPEVAAVLKFYDEFKCLQAHDERAEFLRNLLTFLKQRLLQNPDWSFATNTMVLRAMTTIERYVMFSVYDAAFYPNRELDQRKDKLLRVTIANLASVVTHENDYLNVPRRLHGEAPWPSAQAELTMLDIYVTAQDKLNCVVRCCDVINNLIALSSKNAVASADDLTPILVFVIIKANPRALLSNLQFVETFAGDRIQSGRDAYYWTNFKSAVEYIKTLL